MAIKMTKVQNVLLPLYVMAIILAAAKSNNLADSNNAANSNRINNGRFYVQKSFYFSDRISLGINRWFKFSEWQCIAPPETETAKAAFWPLRAALYNWRIDDSYPFDNVAGDATHFLTLVESTENDTESWIYSFKFNMWRKPLGSNPTVKFDRNGWLVTICSDTIVWIDDHVKDEVWIFDGNREVWLKVDIAQTNASFAPILTSTSTVLSVSVSTLILGSNHTCDCNESIIALNLAGRVATARAMWRQGCFNARNGYFKRVDYDILPDPNTTAGFPVDIAGNTAVSGRSDGIILVIAPSTGLWQYDGKRNCWRFLGNVRSPYRLIPTTEIPMLITVCNATYFRSSRAYVLFCALRELTPRYVFVFDLESEKWFSSAVCHNVNMYKYVMSKVFDVSQAVLSDTRSARFYLYRGMQRTCSQVIVKFEGNDETIESTLLTGPEKSVPETLGVALMNNDSLYHLAYYPPVGLRNLQRLDLTTMQWIILFGHRLEWEQGDNKGAVLHGDVLLFIRFTKYTHLCRMIGYVISENRLVHYENNAVSDSVPPWREEYSLVALNSTSLFLCGGIGDGLEIMSDSWIFTLPSPKSDIAEWKNLTLTLSASSDIIRYPLPRYQHSTAVIGDMVILFGGSSHWNWTCNHDVWHLSLDARKWTLGRSVSQDRSGPSSPTSCVLHVLALGKQVVVLTTGVDLNHANMYVYSIWIYVPFMGLWMFVSKLTASSGYDVAPFFWRGRLLLLDTDGPQLLFSYLDCPAGFVSRNVTDSYCQPCEVGRYSTGAGERQCLPCPEGLTTRSMSATHVTNCSLCVENFCKYGNCLVLQGQQSLLPVCQCTAGFTGTLCQYPTYYLVALGLVVFAIVSTSGVFIILRIRKNKRRREMYLRNHVDQLNSVWQVKENEVQLLDRIGRGGYGEVYRAEYRNITVAVKIMHLPTDESLVREFEREIVYMQTIRHPNIVMFVGAGKMTEDDRPFIVLEFLHRGSVRSVLDDQELTHVRRMEFAHDIANGMKFLHSLNPPRVHRDLKSDNLLVSRSWTVKIGDFGMGKLLGVDEQATIRGHKSSTKRHRYARRSSDPPTLSLLETDIEFSPHAVGAARWRAPEISARYANHGDVTVDVYR